MTEPTSSSIHRVWWIVLLGFVLFWVVYLVFFLPVPAHGVLEPQDYQWPLVDLNEQPTTFASYKGKPVFLNIWATWCGPCVKEMPSIARLAANPRLKGVVFVCASTDDSTEKVRAFLRDKAWGMTFLRITGETPPIFQASGLPTTFIIGADGTIVASEVGALDWDTPDKVALLERLAKSAPAKP